MKKYIKPCIEVLAAEVSDLMNISMPVVNDEGNGHQLAPGRKEIEWDNDEYDGFGW